MLYIPSVMRVALPQAKISDYIVLWFFFSLASYQFMKDRSLLLIAKNDAVRNSRKWKNVLKTHEDGIVICSKGKIVFFNKALEAIINFQEHDDIDIKVGINNK